METRVPLKEMAEDNDDKLAIVEDECSDDDKDITCGIGPFRPHCLNRCANIGVFTVVYGIAGFVTSSLIGYLTSQITSLERQFGFSSSESGFLLGCNDIGYLICAVFAAHFANKLHVPRVLALCTLVFGLSAFLSASPYFLFPIEGDTSNSTSGNSHGSKLPLCNGTVDKCSKDSGRALLAGSISYKSTAFAIIAISMILQGIAKSPRYSFLTVYVDDNVPKTKTGLYMGIITSFGNFGPAMAFGLGSVFSKTYVTLEDRDFNPRDPRWVGAWWLGFITFGAMAVLASIPVALFPRHISRQQPKSLQPPDTEHKENKALTEVKSFCRCLVRLAKNPSFVCVVIGSCAQIFSVAAAVSFLPKYLETQYNLPAWQANVILAGINISAVAIGTFSGGFLTSFFKMGVEVCLKFALVTQLLTMAIIAAGFGLGCSQPQIIGTVLKGSNPVWTDQSEGLSCSSSCGCDDTHFFPVCSPEGQTFFSPCHAGCSSNYGKNITECECVADGWVTPGVCDQNCVMVYPYGVCVFLASLLSTLGIMPIFIVIIRCVREEDRSMAAGITAFLQSLLGWFLGPMIFGTVIDSTCFLWTTECGERGSCAIHDLTDFRVKLHSITIGTRTLNLIFLFLCLLFYRRQHNRGEDLSAQEQTT